MIHPTIKNALMYGLHQHILREIIQSGAARDLYPKQVAEMALRQLAELDKQLIDQLNKALDK